MRPEKLIIEGVYSYKNRIEIDFSTLCRADLFGIFGMVGSGKSAILEAVTYVLYGKIERLSTRVYYNMMNLASSRMHIDFTFLHRQQRYRFTFEAKRSKKDFDKIETPQRGGYILENGEWLPLFDRDGEVTAEGIIGLSYDNFRRTIIVPQGKFQEFLHLEKSKRTEMLMELFNLDRFDLYSKAAVLSGRNNEKKATAEGELKGLAGVTESAAEEARSSLDEAGKTAAAASVRIEKSGKKLAEYEELAALYLRQAETKRSLELKAEEEAEIIRRKANLKEFEDCRLRFKPLLDVFNHLSAEYQEAVKQNDAALVKLEAGRQRLRQAENEFESLESEYRNIDTSRKQAEWLSDLAVLEKDRLLLKDLSIRIAEEQASSDSLKHEREENLEETGNAEQQIEQMDAAGGSIELMNRLSGLFSALGAAAEAADSEQQRLSESEKRSKDISAALEEIGELPAIEKKIETLETEYRRKQLDEGIRERIAELAERLEEGKACPVCGSTDHPAPAKNLEDRLVSEAGGTDAAAVEVELSRLRGLREQYGRLTAEAAAEKSVAAGIRKQLDKRLGDKDAVLKQFPDSSDCGYSPGRPEEFDAAYREFLDSRKKSEKLRKSVAALRADRERLEKRLQAAADSESGLKLEYAAASTRITEAENRIDGDFLELNRGRSTAELQAEAGMIAEKNERLKTEYDSADKAQKEAAVQYGKYLSESELHGKRRTGLADKVRAAEAELIAASENSCYSSYREAAAVLARDLNTDAEREKIEAFEKEVSALNHRRMDLDEKIGDRIYDPGVHAAEKDNNLRLKNGLEQAQARIGELNNIIKELEQRLLRKSELEKELSVLKIRAENINTLKNLFKGKKFIDYAATIYLRELCEAANERFRRLTRESLRLELDESNNFIIRDYLNEGKTRSVKTLSGGQTFQAAFSLSLALADSIGRERSGFFFLDEGFGSLDRESLGLVFESLKSLKKEERTVGIISHVEELKQEIDTFISVRRDSDEGSNVTSSWNS